jgi:hypothetical protein
MKRDTQHNDIQHDDTPIMTFSITMHESDTQHNDIQHRSTQNNDIQHYNK